jgi:transposase
MGALVVGTKDQLRIQIISKVSKGLMRAKDALVLLNVSERTLRRWLRFYEAEGGPWVSHSWQ